jgi:hypothetical protein
LRFTARDNKALARETLTTRVTVSSARNHQQLRGHPGEVDLARHGGAKWDYHNCTGTVDMHRIYRYKSFTVDVDTQPVECVADGTALSAPVGYIAVVSITRGNMPMMGEPLRVGRSDGRLFATEAEALMRGYGDAQTFIDHW